MRRVILVLGLCCAAGAQTFEAADVHASPAGATQSGGILPNGRAEFRGMTLLGLISYAYSIPRDRVAGGPAWLDTDQFDITAKAAGDAPAGAMRSMLQKTLEERFHLAVKREERPMPVFALVASGKKGSAKASQGDGEADCKGGQEENVRYYQCTHVTVANLAERLPMVAAGYFNKPVVDRSGVKGAFDFRLEYLSRGLVPGGSPENSLHLFNSIERQLGLKVETSTAPLPALTVERVERTPEPNPAGTVEKLGPAATEFEVADIKKSRPDETPNADVKNGRVTARALSLKELIAFAYDVEEDWVKGEKFLDTERFDVNAKTAPTAAVDTLRSMLQKLLEDRFKLKLHREPQPVAVYALTSGKPKMKESDGSARSTCKFGLQDGMRVFTCTNVTMERFAKEIRDAGGAYLDHPVVDLTGLKGGYDFSMTWIPRQRLERAPATVDTAGSPVPVASERPVGYTLFESVEKQLGLKLAAAKHPMPVVVVDRCERAPTEN